MPYLIDANVFINAHRTNYPMDIYPSYWQAFVALAHSGNIVSIDKVKDEIFLNNDDLKLWCQEELPPGFFMPFDAWYQYKEVANWANSKVGNPYSESAIQQFLDGNKADAFLVAFAASNHLELVTLEISSPLSKSSIKLPDAAKAAKVSSLSPNSMLRALNVRI